MTKSKVVLLNACPKISINFGIFLDDEAKQSQILKANPSAEPDTGCPKKRLTKNECCEAKFSHERDFGALDPA